LTVTDNNEFSAGLYVPYRGLAPGVQPSGSWSTQMTATGDGSGGQVNVNLFMSKIEFGFHPIFTLQYCMSVDNLAAADEVIFQYSVVGNERLRSAVSIGKTPIANGTSFFAVWVGEDLPIPIEPDLGSDITTRTVATVQWQTNTDTKAYQVNLFGMVWDAEVLARQVGAKMPDYFFGVR